MPLPPRPLQPAAAARWWPGPGSREGKAVVMGYGAHSMQDFLSCFAHSGERFPAARLAGGLLLSALLHLAIILSFGPSAAIPSTAWEQPPPELTVTLVSKAPAPAPLKRARPASESAQPNPISERLPSVPRYFETREVDVPARVVNDVILHYPVSAFQQHISGAVKLKLFINQAGEVDKAEIIASEPREIFDAAAVAAAKQLRYSPALKDGAPVKTAKTIAITFDPTANPL